MSASAAAAARPEAQIRFSVVNGTPTVEMLVPKGASFKQVAALQASIPAETIARISPRGCPTCYSGLNFNIREELEQVILVEMPQLAG